MFYCLIAFILGWLISRHMGNSIGNETIIKHIKDKRGFTVKEYFEYQYNTANMFLGKFIHCSQNVENFTNKKSLAVFTNVKTLHT